MYLVYEWARTDEDRFLAALTTIGDRIHPRAASRYHWAVTGKKWRDFDEFLSLPLDGIVDLPSTGPTIFAAWVAAIEAIGCKPLWLDGLMVPNTAWKRQQGSRNWAGFEDKLELFRKNVTRLPNVKAPLATVEKQVDEVLRVYASLRADGTGLDREYHVGRLLAELDKLFQARTKEGGNNGVQDS
jgi:hypothetical protein